MEVEAFLAQVAQEVEAFLAQEDLATGEPGIDTKEEGLICYDIFVF